MHDGPWLHTHCLQIGHSDDLTEDDRKDIEFHVAKFDREYRENIEGHKLDGGLLMLCLSRPTFGIGKEKLNKVWQSKDELGALTKLSSLTLQNNMIGGAMPQFYLAKSAATDANGTAHQLDFALFQNNRMSCQLPECRQEITVRCHLNKSDPVLKGNIGKPNCTCESRDHNNGELRPPPTPDCWLLIFPLL